MKASSRSINPPWPGMRALESLTLKRRLTAEFEQIAEFGYDRRAEADPEQRCDAVGPGREQPGRGRRRRAPPTIAPDQVLPGETAGQSLRAADEPAGEIGGDVGAPDDCEQPQNRGHSVARAGPEQPEADNEGAGVDRPGSRPALRARPRDGGDRRHTESERERGPENSLAQREQILHCEPGGDEESERARGHSHEQPIRAHEPLPFPQHDDRGDAPERDKNNSAGPRRRERDRPQRDGRGDAWPQVPADARPGRASRPSTVLARAAHGHAPVLTRPT